MKTGDALLAALLTLGGHESGHEVEADRQNVPMGWDNGLYFARTDDPGKLARIGGAGFRAGDGMTNALAGTRYERPARVVNALNKIGYAAFPESLQGGEGDAAMINRTKGNNAGQAALTVSALADLYKAYRPDQRWDLNYWQGEEGTPGLQFTYRW